MASSIKEIFRLLEQGQALTATPLYKYTHHNRAVRDAASKCIYARKKEEQQTHYKKLLQLTRKSKEVLVGARFQIENALQQKPVPTQGKYREMAG